MSTNGHAHQRAATSPAYTSMPHPQPQPVQQVTTPPSSPGVLRKAAPRAQVPVSVLSRSSELEPTETEETSANAKPAPRAQVPVSIIDEDDHETAEVRPRTRDLPPFGSPTRPDFGMRTNLPSRVPEGVEDMTGVGSTVGQKTPDVFYTTTPFTPTARENGYGPDTDSFYGTAGGVVEQAPQTCGGVAEEPFEHNEEEEGEKITNLLHPTAFHSMALTSGSRSTSENSQSQAHPSPTLERDSAMTRDVPVAWTGTTRETLSPPLPPALDTRASSTPFFPGAWAPTPVHELPAFQAPQPSEPMEDNNTKEKTPVQDNEDRVESPIIAGSEAGRKSEAGLVVTLEDGEWKAAKVPSPGVPTLIPSPSSPPTNTAARTNGASPETPPVGGQGWVIVDVSGQPTPTPTSPPVNSPFVPPPSTLSAGEKHKLDEQAALSPSAKAIAIVDAVQEREKERTEPALAGLSRITSSSNAQESVASSSITSPGRNGTNTGGSVRRFLSLSSPRKDKEKEGEKKTLRSRLRKWGA